MDTDKVTRSPILDELSRADEAADTTHLSAAGVDGIECVVRGADEEEVGILRLEIGGLGGSQEGIRNAEARSQRVETSDADVGLTASYEIIEVSSDLSAIPDEVLSKLDQYATVAVHRHARRLQFEDIVEAVSAQQRAVRLTADNRPELSLRLSNLGRSLALRYDYTGDEEDLDEAISVGRRAVELASQDGLAIPAILNNLSLSLKSRFEETEELEDIDEAISLLERAVRLVPEDHAELSLLLSSLSDSLAARFETSDDATDLSEIVACKRRVVLCLRGLSSLANSLSALYERLGNIDDIAEAIAVHRQLVELTPDTHPNLHARLNNFGTTLQARFQRTGQLCDINEAISVKRKAVDLTRSGDLRDITEAISVQRRAVELTKQGDTNMPSRPLAKAQDIADAVSSLREAVKLTGEDSDDLPSWLNNLGIAFLRSFEHAGSLGDIDEAISVQKRAIHFTPQDHTYLPTRLNNLGNSLKTRFERTGDLQDITEAIAAQERSVELTPEGHASPNDLRDIAEAISAQQRAVQLTPTDHAELATRLNNLGNSFATRFEYTEEIFDVDEAVSGHLELLGTSYTSRFQYTEDAWDIHEAVFIPRLNNLGYALQSRFRTHPTTAMTSDKAISAQRRAVRLTADDHAELPYWLYSFGKSLSSRFARTNDPVDLDEAIVVQRKAVGLTPDAHGQLADQLDALAQSLHTRWALGSNRTDLDESITHPTLSRRFNIAIDMMLVLAGLANTVKRRYSYLQGFSGLPQEAAAAACRHGQPHKAVEWLEQGRCLVWGQLNTLRSPFDAVRNGIEAVAKSLENAGASRGVPNIGMSASEKVSLEAEARAHLTLARKWDDLVNTVRAIPGNLPGSGATVVINVHKDRCDAIVLMLGRTEPQHLQGLRMRGEEEEIEMVERAMGPYRQKRDPTKDAVHDVLLGLWIEVVKPILEALGISKLDRPAGGSPPRIWWCPTGPLSFLPLHAAGVYSYGESESILDYVVKAEHAIDEGVSGLFLTCQPKAPGASSIPGTTREVTAVFDRASLHGLRMEAFSSIHLACHASQNSTEFLQSRFLFHRGSLSLDSIMKQNLKNADLAFLSACQTSAGEETLSDEAVHLAAGMLAAGYRRVVATMWAIRDRYAPEIATDFYQYLWDCRTEGCGTGFDGSQSAYALHHATQQLRARLGDTEKPLLTWVPYVHFGY
ncbi:hypothetical protein FA13DRAFT_1741788 [Coprinellus micaceus]|uniref:CHAT domain-containing protein n=1 Tax=Coprinellus micaceus TaxID=71717 RepID=A0A4Y7SI84_COPMI|nr:hypothetical protein FA13DRAFT_1741788 [Coprinellus micaceus]